LPCSVRAWSMLIILRVLSLVLCTFLPPAMPGGDGSTTATIVSIAS